MARYAILLLCFMVFCMVEGCYTTVVRVDTHPPGATVHYDYQPKGVTPVEFDVDYLGKHKLTLDHPEFGRRVEFIDLKSPAYATFPLDFFVTLLPFKVTDKQSFSFDLTQPSDRETEAKVNESEGSE